MQTENGMVVVVAVATAENNAKEVFCCNLHANQSNAENVHKNCGGIPNACA